MRASFRVLLLVVAGLAFLITCGRSDDAEGPTPLASGRVSAPFDFGAVMRQVHFAYRAESGGFTAGHSTYSVRVDAEGRWALTPYHHPQDTSGAVIRGEPLQLETASITRGSRALARPGKAALEKVGGLEVDRGVAIEALRNSDEGVTEQWTFARKPAGTGALTVRLDVSGLAYAGETERGLHFAGRATRLGVRFGDVAWTDARGQRTPLRARYASGRLVLTVPEELLETSSYPAILAPVVSPEIGMDDPVSGPTAGIQSLPAMASDGQLFLVVWQDKRDGVSNDIYGARVTAEGVVLDTAGIQISSASGDQNAPGIAFDGTGFLVVWQDYRSGGNPDIYGARIGSDGVVLEPNGLAISNNSAAQVSPSVAFNGQDYLVAWADFRNTMSQSDIYGARVTPAGLVLDPAGFAIGSSTNAQTVPAVASGFSGISLVVWQDQRTGGSHVWGARVAADGSVLEPTGISISGGTSVEINPAVAFDGQNFLVAWDDNRSGLSYDIYGKRVSPFGLVIDSTAIGISVQTGNQQAAALAFDGTNYVVTWQDARLGATDIYATRVAPDGTVSPAAGIPISTAINGQAAPAVAVTGGYALIAWADNRASSNSDIYAARLGRTGGVVETTGVLLSTSANSQSVPAVAYGGDMYLVVWQDNRGGGTDLFGTRVDNWGYALDPGGIAISTAANNQSAPAVVYDGQQFFVVWQDGRNSNVNDIFGTRVALDGTVLDPAGIPISTALQDQNVPSIATDGLTHWVVWHDYRAGFAADIYGARVSADGTVLDPNGVAISPATNDQLIPAVAYNGSTFLAVWHDFRSGSTSDIYGARLTAAGAVVDPTGFAISTAVNSQTTVALASDGVGFLATWRDSRSPGYDVYAARVSGSGSLLDPTGIAVATGTGDQTSPAVTFDGVAYVLVWQDTRSGRGNDLYAARVGSDGVVQDPTGFVVSNETTDELGPMIAAGAYGQSMVVYQRLDPSSPFGTQRVRGRFITTIDPPDGGWPDAGRPDAGRPDGGRSDAGAPDGGGVDGGSTLDGGSGGSDGGLDGGGGDLDGGSDGGGGDLDGGGGDLDGGFDGGGGDLDGGFDGGGGDLDGGGGDLDGGFDGGGGGDLDGGFDGGSGEPDGGGGLDGGSGGSDAGFDGGSGTPDGGSGGSDAGFDGGSGGSDAGSDAGVGEPDAGGGGGSDAGSETDAGVKDAGIPDSGTPDAGSTGEPDAGGGGETDGGSGGETPGGCGCTSTPSAFAPFTLGLMLLAWAGRRRRAAASATSTSR